MEYNGKVALVTGAGSGIGKSAALLFARLGAKVCITSRTEEELKAVAEEISTNGGTASYLPADISKEEDVQKLFQKCSEDYGRLDAVFANAGVNGVWAPLEELTADDWDRTLTINLKGTFLTVKYAVPFLKKQGGAVVITSSINGTRTFSNSGATAYACSKAAQVAFCKMTALELAKYNIRVNVICPGAIESEIDENTTKQDLEKAREPVEFPEGQIPLNNGKPGSPEEVAQLVAFLCSDQAAHITGTPVWIDGGQSLLRG